MLTSSHAGGLCIAVASIWMSSTACGKRVSSVRGTCWLRSRFHLRHTSDGDQQDTNGICSKGAVALLLDMHAAGGQDYNCMTGGSEIGSAQIYHTPPARHAQQLLPFPGGAHAHMHR